VDEREETLGRKIRDAELAKIPYVVVWGERESLDALASGAAEESRPRSAGRPF
jgi:threonyl-tRNA synthetase